MFAMDTEPIADTVSVGKSTTGAKKFKKKKSKKNMGYATTRSHMMPYGE